MAPARSGHTSGCTKPAAAVCVCAVLAMSAQPAWAADWKWLYQLGSTAQYSDNIELLVHPKRPAGSDSTTGHFDLKALSPAWEWALAGDFGYLVYFGEGAPAQRTSMNGGANSKISTSARDTDYSLSAHFSEAPAQSTQLTDLGIVNSNILQLNYGVMADVAHRANQLDTFDANIKADRSDFSQTSPGVTPSSSLQGAGTWTRRLTRLIDGRVKGSVLYYRLEGNSQTEQLIYNIAVGGKARISKRLTIDAEIGPTLVQQLGPGSMTSVDVSGNVTLTYQPFRDVNFDLTLSQDVSPDNLGALNNVQSVAASVRYQVNDYASLSLLASFNNSAGTGKTSTSSKYVTVSPSLSYQLARNWNAVLSYRWIRLDQGVGIAQSNSVFFTINYNGVLVH